jgi:serine/threonine protein kinase
MQEYLSGGTLLDKLAFPLTWQEQLYIADQICQGMIYAHENDIIHGNLRPTNILFTHKGKLKLTDFALKDDLDDVEFAHYYRLLDEKRSKAGDIYATGVVLYQLFTSCLPDSHNDTNFIVRKSFTRLPDDIQMLVTNMLSTLPKNRNPDSLKDAVNILSRHRNPKRNKTFTGLPQHDKNQQTGFNADNVATVAQRQHPQLSMRMSILFGILTLVYAQYLFIFDGQEKINESMPAAYSSIVNKLEGLLGQIDAGYSEQSAGNDPDSRLY